MFEAGPARSNSGGGPHDDRRPRVRCGDDEQSGGGGGAGLSKGALYLYFRSKEELLLALFEDALETLVARIEREADARTLVEVMARTPREVPLFLPLLARIVAMIEVNVPDPPLFAAKRNMLAMCARVATVIERATGAGFDQAREAASVLMLTMQGAAHADISAQRDPATIPPDLRTAFRAQAFENRFPAAVRLILTPLFAQPS
ncbi:TetR/AcrR family transcriptional regulator [Sphingomonas sp. ac-8]|uniref:TetR/AcrR family transcriptional regulator n=1 Tax=Sphingomonas sp. ac-8 TaxID=3242977 RepID=UPI003A80A94B